VALSQEEHDEVAEVAGLIHLPIQLYVRTALYVIKKKNNNKNKIINKNNKNKKTNHTIKNTATKQQRRTYSFITAIHEDTTEVIAAFNLF
jgi:hypothetical protein